MTAWSLPDIAILAVVFGTIAGVLWYLRPIERDGDLPDEGDRRVPNFRIYPPVYDWDEHEDEVEA